MRTARGLMTIECVCGATGETPVGALVACECGRRFEAAPPAEHAAELDRLRRRHRALLAASLLSLVVLCAAPLLVLDRSAALMVPVAALALWAATVRPRLQRRHRRRMAALPAWSLG